MSALPAVGRWSDATHLSRTDHCHRQLAIYTNEQAIRESHHIIRVTDTAVSTYVPVVA